MEGEDAFELLEKMFNEYHLDEYKEAFEKVKEDWERTKRSEIEKEL